jgi:hypothetical protein
MHGALNLRTIRSALVATAVAAAMLAIVAGGAVAADTHTTGMFMGVKANKGFATHSKDGKTNVLTLSADFVVPDSPAPHWQVVDSKGNVYLLQRLVIKDDVFHKTITVPAYVKDIAKVQIWCAWAEVLLGEASFEKPVS